MASSQNRTRTRVDTCNDMGHTSNLSLSWDKRGIRAKRAHFLVGSCEREEKSEREEKNERGESSFLPRSTKFRGSVFVWPRTKVHRIDERYAWVPEKRDFTEDPRGEISGNRSCRV